MLLLNLEWFSQQGPEVEGAQEGCRSRTRPSGVLVSGVCDSVFHVHVDTNRLVSLCKILLCLRCEICLKARCCQPHSQPVGRSRARTGLRLL